MAQMIPNAAIIQGTIIGIEPYFQQEGFVVLSLIVKKLNEKTGMRFLGDNLSNKEIKVLLNANLVEKLKIELNKTISGEVKKVSPVLWRASEDTWQLKQPSLGRSIKATKKK